MFEVYENVCGETQVAEGNISYTLVNPSEVLWGHSHHIAIPGSEGTGNEQNDDDTVKGN
jgi:hypothetical protein